MEAEGLRTEAAQLDAQAAEQDSAVGGAGEHHQPSDGEYPNGLEAELERIRRAAPGAMRSRQRSRTPRRQSLAQQADAAERGTGQAAGCRLRLRRSRPEAPPQEAEALRGTGGHRHGRRRRRRVRRPPPSGRRPEQITDRRRMAAQADREAAERAARGTRPGRPRPTAGPWRTPRRRRTAAANIISGHTLRMEERKKKADAAGRGARVKLTMDVGALDNRIRLLTEMEKDYEGFHKAVKLVCQAQSEPPGHPRPGGGPDEDRREVLPGH